MELTVQPVEGGANVIDFAGSVVMLSRAQSGAAEIEAEDGESETVQGFHGVEHDFVVHGPAEHGMRMADQGGVGGVRSARVKQGFEASGGAVEKEGADCGAGHAFRLHAGSEKLEVRRNQNAEVRSKKLGR